MSSKNVHLINGSKILCEFETNFLMKVKILYVFNDNKNQSNIFLVTNDDQTYSLGGNAFGVLGFGHKNSVKRLTINKNLCNKGLVDFKNGSQHMIGRTSDGKVYGWGNNKWGALGTGKRNDKIYKPKLNKYLKDEVVVEISTGFWHTLALTDESRLYSWGDNTWGQIGTGSDCKNIGLTPKHLDVFRDEKVVSVSCGAYHSLVLTEAGLVFSWGNNSSGQLGIGLEGNSLYPQPILQTGIKVIKISAGLDHNLILSKEGFIYGFGCNECGELGSTADKVKKQFVPKRLKSSEKFIDIETENSYPFSAALSETGLYYMWGLCDRLSHELIFEPKAMHSYQSFEELFIEELKITHKPIYGFSSYFQRRISVQCNDKLENICENVRKFSLKYT